MIMQELDYPVLNLLEFNINLGNILVSDLQNNLQHNAKKERNMRLIKTVKTVKYAVKYIAAHMPDQKTR